MYAACLLYTKSFTNRIHFESFLSAVVLSILRIFSALKLESAALIYVTLCKIFLSECYYIFGGNGHFGQQLFPAFSAITLKAVGVCTIC